MHRISILDRISGCPLFDNIWHWKEDQHTPESAASLNHFFHQLAQTVDEGIVKKVIFEQASGEVVRGDRKHVSSIFARHRMHSDRRKAARVGRQKLELYTSSNTLIVVNLYVDSNFRTVLDPMKIALETQQLFTKQYKETLLAKKEDFHRIALMKDPDGRSYLGCLKEFELFKSTFMEDPFLLRSVDVPSRIGLDNSNNNSSNSSSSSRNNNNNSNHSSMASSRDFERRPRHGSLSSTERKHHITPTESSQSATTTTHMRRTSLSDIIGDIELQLDELLDVDLINDDDNDNDNNNNHQQQEAEEEEEELAVTADTAVDTAEDLETKTTEPQEEEQSSTTTITPEATEVVVEMEVEK